MRFCPECRTELIERNLGGANRRCCPDATCGFVHWNNPMPVVAVIVETPDGVLLAHNKSWPASWYSVITGFLEAGETPEECARRETREETGLETSAAAFIGIYPFHQKNQLILAYHVRAQGSVTLNEELDDYKIIPKAELKGWNSATGYAVRDWLKQ